MTDLIEQLVGIESGSGPGSALHALRAERAEIRDHAQGAYRELVTPEQPGGVSLPERTALAVIAARLERDEVLANHFADLPAGQAAGPRLPMLAAYAGTVGKHPDQVDQDQIDALRSAGLSAQDIVAVTQLAAFVPYQVRVMAGLRAMQGHPGHEREMPAVAARDFTTREVGWNPRLPPVDAATATPAQLAALEACPPAQRRSTYFLTLAHDPASLGERGALFNSVMYAPRGLPRADRELATAVVSLVNGCVYCFSVHARRFEELAKDPAVMPALIAGLGADLGARRSAIVAFSAKLTASPSGVGAADVAALRAAGLAELEVLDLVHAVAMFANANRLMQALGDAVLPG